MEAFHMTVDRTDFRVYSKEEILQLSVKEIVNPQTFDLLQNPVVGGLHDPSLGPCRRDDRCESCGQSEKNCPGHMGHINLPVLLFNPIFFKTLLKLLKGTCLSCHRVNLPSLHIQLYTYQIEMLHRGFLTESQDLVERFYSTEKAESVALREMKSYVDQIFNDFRTDTYVVSKNLLTQIHNVVTGVLKTFMTMTTVCRHCHTRNRSLRAEYNRTIVGTLVDERRVPRRIKPTEEKESEGSGDTEAMPGEEIEMENQEKPLDDDIGAAELVSLDSELQTEMKLFLNSKHKRCILSPNIAREHLKLLWENNRGFLSKLFPFLAGVRGADTPTDVFFLDVLPVPPTRFRPLSVMKERKYEHPQTANLSNVIRECEVLRDLLRTYAKTMEGVLEDSVQGPSLSDTTESVAIHMQKVMVSWLRLQSKVNVVLDSDLDKLSQDKCHGVKQLLEKKEGLFRMHMMGKRVNFAARSVISPDPYIGTNEIGIPMVFASRLTYPQPVTPWNVVQLRQMVINGPLTYPGAASVIDEKGGVVRLNPTNPTQRAAIAKQLLVPDKSDTGTKVVCRHLINGDFLLLNRQPTLHRPSIQAHKARVLPDIKTLRLHYANCNAYNADFDGDEMNAHFPQSELSRAEAATIAATDNQYLVPRDGTPLAGLIQDHIVAGVGLTIRGRFFSRKDYCGLLWCAMNECQDEIKLLPPSIIKPRPLWSGKQIISTILLNITPEGKAPLNLKSKAKVSEKSWRQPNWSTNASFSDLNLERRTALLGESTVVFSQGELLQGILDKAHYGPSAYGLIHCCYELYGGDVAGRFLTFLGRLFTSFLQLTGFSLGAGDILVLRKANRKRKTIIKKSQNLGRDEVVKALGLVSAGSEINDSDLLLELKRAHFDKQGMRMAEIDLCMKRETDKVQNNIARCIMPGGLEKGFPENSLQLLVQSGAKGSPVNCMQISCLLGQIELEGRRPPLMLSGRSLPSFLPYDVSPRAGGFVTGRFLTGIRPQEYFFHCMAGREGLIDTAVKTSRSGYLQRCLVKHLEGLMVNYDMTVRDSDGSLVQFYYGEDGLEPVRCPYLKPAQFPFLTENLHAVLGSCKNDPWLTNNSAKRVKRTWKKISRWKAYNKEMGTWINRENGFLEFSKSEAAPAISETDLQTLVTSGKCFGRSQAAKILCGAWEKLSDDERENWCNIKSCPDPVMSTCLPHSQPDVLSEQFRHLLNVYCKKGFHKVVSQMSQPLNPESFKMAINKKLIQALAQPGESVGLVCAQSIGEPSTQMTLNTFHFAGRGEMNVTLGIPRLREILMTGSARIKTPSMDVPVQPSPDARLRAERLKRHLNKITLDKVLQYMRVRTYLNRSFMGSYKMVEVKLKFLHPRDYSEMTNLTPRAILRFVAKRLLAIINTTIKKETAVLERATLLSSGRLRRTLDSNDDEAVETAGSADAGNESSAINNEGDDVEVEPNDGDMSAVKEHQRQLDTQGYEGEEEERKEVVTVRDDEEDGEDDVEVTIVEKQEEAEEDSSGDDEEMKGDLSKEDRDLITQALSYEFVEDFKLDEKKNRWCTVTLKYEQSGLQLDMRMLLEKVIRTAVLHQVKGITQAFLSEENEDGETVLHLKTEGINIQEMFKYPDVLDLNRIYSNCIHTMALTYGVEAANRIIIKEIQNVFGAYGIVVDYRHLSLLADFMTARGEYDAFNRRDISYNTSPLQKMTFETTMSFLLDACVTGSVEELKSPSAQLVLGTQIGMGTGCFHVLDPL